MAEQDYNDLLKRAREGLPEKVIAHERFKIPDADVFIEGKTTVLRNFEDISNAIDREPQQVLAYLLRELGTAGTIDGRRAVFKGRVSPTQIEDRISGYVETYVLCSECKRPDTRIVKEERITILECDACGAHRPVEVRKGSGPVQEKALEEGKVYEVTIQDIGRRGDGIAKVDKYTIFVPGTAKGTTVKIEIEKISGSVAFAHIVRE
ncbi:MAG: translation initiation factor IF-2 subunit beta [Methanobacteriota archaeon]|nr:MAG: translation initiation factor IF-2 subunit beta [Euryarchaeota archaeon]